VRGGGGLRSIVWNSNHFEPPDIIAKSNERQ
jgi:hypothetical protein